MKPGGNFMKRGGNPRRTPLERKSRLDRKPMARSQPKRDWSEVRAKVEREHCCRVCIATTGADWRGGPPEAAHIIGRGQDRYPLTAEYSPDNHDRTWKVEPVRIVPLCHKHHRAYDAHELDLLPYLSVEEQAQAVLDAGGLELARKRICGEAA